MGISSQLPASVSPAALPHLPMRPAVCVCVCVCEGGAVSHSSDLIQLKFNLRVTSFSQRSPTRHQAPFSGLCVCVCVCAAHLYCQSAASPPPAPGCRLTRCQWASLGGLAAALTLTLILRALRGDTLYLPLRGLNGAPELSLEKAQLSQMSLRT